MSEKRTQKNNTKESDPGEPQICRLVADASRCLVALHSSIDNDGSCSSNIKKNNKAPEREISGQIPSASVRLGFFPDCGNSLSAMEQGKRSAQGGRAVRKDEER